MYRLATGQQTSIRTSLIAKLIINFMKKYKLLDAEMKRKKFAITIGDEPAKRHPADG